MNPDEKEILKSIDMNWLESSSDYTFQGAEEIENHIKKFLNEGYGGGRSNRVNVTKNNDSINDQKEIVKVRTPIVHSWKMRERRYRAWTMLNGEGKMVESDSFNFLTEFFQHIEENYDSYDLMDGVCLNEEEDTWVYEGDFVHICSGECYQGYYEHNIKGFIDQRGSGYYVVNQEGVLYDIDHFLEEDAIVNVLGHAYDNKTEEKM